MIRLEGDDPHARMVASWHRRELAERRRRRLWHLRMVLAVPAAIGWLFALHQVTQPDPVDWIAVGGAMLSVPFLSTFSFIGPPEEEL